MFTVLWCYLRNAAFKTKEKDYHLSADLTGQANHLGVTIEADIIKQKLPENNGGYNAVNFGKTHKDVYAKLSSDNPIDLTRYQVANCYMGRMGLINSGGASSGESDMKEAVKTAVINKRAGGMGLISGRKAFQRPMKEGVELLNAIQDVYLAKDVTIGSHRPGGRRATAERRPVVGKATGAAREVACRRAPGARAAGRPPSRDLDRAVSDGGTGSAPRCVGRNWFGAALPMPVVVASFAPVTAVSGPGELFMGFFQGHDRAIEVRIPAPHVDRPTVGSSSSRINPEARKGAETCETSTIRRGELAHDILAK